MYLNFYGFSEYPFYVTPDPRFIFWTRQHREALDHLLYGIHGRKGFIELTGEVGTGKTTLCRACLEQLGDEVETALILNPLMGEAELLRAMAHDFGLILKNHDRLSCLQALNRFLLDQNRRGRNVVLFIDEAQDLPSPVMEQIRLLSNLETDRSKLMQIVLCGQPELRVRLNLPALRQLRQRISVRFSLKPLGMQEAADYVAHRLAVAGNGKAAPVHFTPSALWMMYAYSKGMPRMINAVADHALLAGYVEQRMGINEQCVHRAIEQLEGETS